MCSLERTQDSDPTPTIVSPMPTPAKWEPLAPPEFRVVRSRPESFGVVRSHSESSRVSLESTGIRLLRLQTTLDDSERLRTTPGDSERLRANLHDSGRRLRATPGNSGRLQTIPNDFQTDRSRLRIFDNSTHYQCARAKSPPPPVFRPRVRYLSAQQSTANTALGSIEPM